MQSRGEQLRVGFRRRAAWTHPLIKAVRPGSPERRRDLLFLSANPVFGAPTTLTIIVRKNIHVFAQHARLVPQVSYRFCTILARH